MKKTTAIVLSIASIIITPYFLTINTDRIDNNDLKIFRDYCKTTPNITDDIRSKFKDGSAFVTYTINGINQSSNETINKVSSSPIKIPYSTIFIKSDNNPQLNKLFAEYIKYSSISKEYCKTSVADNYIPGGQNLCIISEKINIGLTSNVHRVDFIDNNIDLDSGSKIKTNIIEAQNITALRYSRMTLSKKRWYNDSKESYSCDYPLGKIINE